MNDVSALRHDPAMAEVVRAAGVPVCLMHMQGTPGTMQDDPRYVDVVAEVRRVPGGAGQVRASRRGSLAS